jgi:hypothetical protein
MTMLDVTLRLIHICREFCFQGLEGSKIIQHTSASSQSHYEKPTMGALCEYCKDFSIACILKRITSTNQASTH